jgi:hypothetical protein
MQAIAQQSGIASSLTPDHWQKPNQQIAMKTTRTIPGQIIVTAVNSARDRKRLVVSGLMLLTLLLVGSVVRGQTDDFNDGNDNGWARINPLGDIGAAIYVPELGLLSSWTVANGKYVIRCEGVPAAGVGPARAGSGWTNASFVYTNFYMSADLMGLDVTPNVAAGFVARMQPPIPEAPGVVVGYSLTYEPIVKDFQISALTIDGQILAVAATKLTLELTNTYHFEFLGRGTYLEARIYASTNLVTPLATVSGTDSSYTSGWCGLLIYNSQGPVESPVQTTFDNYLAQAEEPPPLSVKVTGSQAVVNWPSWASSFKLQRTPTLGPASWSQVTSGIVSNETGFSYSTPATNRTFFRLTLN